MAIEQIIEKIGGLNKKLAELKKEVIKEASTTFEEAVQALFEKHPRLNTFTWNQYTPFFNDGDPCTFQVYDVETINGFCQWDDGSWAENQVATNDEAEEKFNPWAVYKWRKEEMSDPEAWEMVNDLNSLFKVFPKDALLDMFGDHQTITCRRGQTTLVEECNHD